MAGTKVQIKRSSVAGRVPTAADIDVGQLAINFTDNRFFTKDGSNTVIDVHGQSLNTTANVTFRDGSFANVSATTLTGNLEWSYVTSKPDLKIDITGDATGTNTFTALANGSINITLANTTVVAGTYGNSSAIPVLTVDSKGRVTVATTNTVAGITGYSYTSANNTFAITAGDGSTYRATIGTVNTLSVSNTLTVTGVGTFSNDVNITGNLTVQGVVSFINTTTLNIGDNFIVLNANTSGAPTLNAGIEVNRGTSSNVLFQWDETADHWTLTNDGTLYENIATNNDVSSAVSTLTTLINDKSANAYSNAVSYADTKAATAYSNATSYADSKAATAYSNATSYADTAAATAYSNAVSVAATDASSKAATAYSNATSYADTAAATAYSNAASYADTKAATAYTNAVSVASTDATTKAGTAYSNAVSFANTIAATAYSNAVSTAAADASSKAETAYANAISDAATYTNSAAATAYSNAVSVAATDASSKAATAYSNAVTQATTLAATAYSNATSYADTKAAAAYSNAVSYTDTKAATAYSNATSYADTVAATAYSNAVSTAATDASTKADTAYTNAVSYASSIAATAFSNAVSYADAKAATAYSNAVSVAATDASSKAATAYSNAVSTAAADASTKAATAYSNATSYAASAATTAYNNAVAYADDKAANAYSNAVAYAASNSYVNTTFAPKSSPSFTGVTSFQAVSANGSLGTPGQVLTTNGSNTYWSSVATGGFTNGQSISVANLAITGSVTANGSTGTTGQVLTTNGTATYWSTVTSSGPGTTYQLWTPANTTSANVVLAGSDSSFANAKFVGAGGISVSSDGTVITVDGSTITSGGNSFSTIVVAGQSNVVAEQVLDTLTLIAGNNIVLTTNATNDSITISSTASGGGSTGNSAGNAFISGRDNFTGDGTTTAFTLSQTATANSILVLAEGLVQFHNEDYDVSGTTLTFTSAPANNERIEVVFISGASTYHFMQFSAIDTFTGDGSTTAFTLSRSANTASATVYLDGLLQAPTTDFSFNDTTLTFTAAPLSGEVVLVYHNDSISSAVPGTSIAGIDVFTGDGVTTSFTMAAAANSSTGMVTVNGLLQGYTTEYTMSGTTLGFIEAPPDGSAIQVVRLAGSVGSAYASITVGSTTIEADSPSAGLTIANTSGVMVDASNSTLTFGLTNIAKQSLTGNGSNTQFTLSYSATADDIFVYVNGIYFHPDEDYTVSDTTITFIDAPVDTSQIRIRFMRAPNALITYMGDLGSGTGGYDMSSVVGPPVDLNA